MGVRKPLGHGCCGGAVELGKGSGSGGGMGLKVTEDTEDPRCSGFPSLAQQIFPEVSRMPGQVLGDAGSAEMTQALPFPWGLLVW